MHAMIADLITAAFWMMASLCCMYGIVLGGRDGRHAALLIILAVPATKWAQDTWRDWGTTHFPVMVVDLLLLAGLLVLALRSRSFWPLWMTASQLLAVVTHVATFFTQGHSQRIYAGLEGVWAIPCLLSMVVGISLDRRSRSAGRPVTKR